MDLQLPRQGFDLGRGNERAFPGSRARPGLAGLRHLPQALITIASKPASDARTPLHCRAIYRRPRTHFRSWQTSGPGFRVSDYRAGFPALALDDLETETLRQLYLRANCSSSLLWIPPKPPLLNT